MRLMKTMRHYFEWVAIWHKMLGRYLRHISHYAPASRAQQSFDALEGGFRPLQAAKYARNIVLVSSSFYIIRRTCHASATPQLQHQFVGQRHHGILAIRRSSPSMGITRSIIHLYTSVEYLSAIEARLKWASTPKKRVANSKVLHAHSCH